MLIVAFRVKKCFHIGTRCVLISQSDSDMIFVLYTIARVVHTKLVQHFPASWCVFELHQLTFHLSEMLEMYSTFEIHLETTPLSPKYNSFLKSKYCNLRKVI